MRVIKIAILLIICSISQSIFAQNAQIGYVKTRGRIVDGKLIPGRKLSGVVIRILGKNDVMSDNDGQFFIVDNSGTNTFTISRIVKNGYELMNTNILNQKKQFSNEPLVIVLEESQILQEDKLMLERKIRRILQRQLQQKEDEIESSKEQKKLTEDEYRKQLQDLYYQQENNEKLINDMVESYKRIDYDLIDDFTQIVSDYIIAGELQKADSLLKTKENISTLYVEIELEKVRLDEERAKIKKEMETLSNVRYNLFEKYLVEQKNDSASYYLDLRAQLDTTDYKLATETGKLFLEELSNDNKAIFYFTRAKEIAIQKYSSEHPDVASSLQNIGNVFLFRGNYYEAIIQYNQSLELYRTLMGDSSRYVGLSLMNVGIANNSMRKYDKALGYYNKSLEIFENIYKTDNNKDIADVYNNMGVSCENKKDYELALSYYKKAFEIRNAIYDYKHQEIAISCSNIAGVFDALGDYKSAIENYRKCIEILKVARGSNHPDVALAYNNLAATYYNMDDYKNAEIYFELSFQILSRVLPSDHPEIRAVRENIDVLESYLE